MLEVGDTVIFCGSESTARPDRVRVDFDGFAALVTERSQIVDRRRRAAARGRARRRRRRRHAGALARARSAPRKGVNVTYARPELPAITEKDVADLALAAELGADFVALSFVRSAADIEQLRDRMLELGCAARVIAKIEKVEAYEHLDEIIARHRRRDGRARRLRRRGRRRARAADAEGHDRAARPRPASS